MDVKDNEVVYFTRQCQQIPYYTLSILHPAIVVHGFNIFRGQFINTFGLTIRKQLHMLVTGLIFPAGTSEADRKKV